MGEAFRTGWAVVKGAGSAPHPYVSGSRYFTPEEEARMEENQRFNQRMRAQGRSVVTGGRPMDAPMRMGNAPTLPPEEGGPPPPPGLPPPKGIPGVGSK